MSWRLIVLNAALGIVCVALATGIVRTLLLKRLVPETAGPAAPRAAGAPNSSVPAEAAAMSAAEYAAISARNLFNPSRSETVIVATSTAKPLLHGVVIDGTKSRAYLEDPPAKRVVGFSVGDEVAGGRIQKIASDRVLIARPEGVMEVLLRDPSKPREAPTAAVAPPVTLRPGQFATTQPGPPPNQASPIPRQVAPRSAAGSTGDE